MAEDRKTVLLVEDNPVMLKSLTQALEREGCTVLTAVDGTWGLDTALREKPQLVVLDVMMPNMDGISMLKKLREDAWGQTVPVIILTNLNYVEDMPELKGLAPDFLLKPDVELKDIVQRVKEKMAA
jgi:DNA-binding response OmpR family regulator